MQGEVGIHCFVSGRVQGVWYRASTQNKAQELEVVGWAKNLADGRVEVMAFGEKNKLDELHAWLKIGPERAEVTEVTIQEIPFEKHERFSIK